MYSTHSFGPLTLQLFTPMKSAISITDLCCTAGTLEFHSFAGRLDESIIFFKLSYPGFELEAGCGGGGVYIRRNEYIQHSEKKPGAGRMHVSVQWDVDSIACGISPFFDQPENMDHHTYGLRTPYTAPPIEIHRILRTNSLLVGTAYKTTEDFFATVIDCLDFVERDIRKYGAERYVWGKNGESNRPLDEPDISRFIASYLAPYGAARNFDVSCESIAGNGNVDFWVVAPVVDAGMAKIAIEAKKANHANLSQGLSHQLPAYMNRLQAHHGIFLIYWLKSQYYPHPGQSSYPYLEFEVLRPIKRPPNIRTLCIDLSITPIPSRLGQ